MTWLRTDYRSARTGRPLDGATFNCYLMRLKQLLAVLHKSGRYPFAAPLRGVTPATAEPQANRAYSDEQKARLLPALRAADPALALLVELMYYTLARPAELVQIRVRHVRPDVIEVPASVSKTRRLRFPLITPPLRALLDGLQLEGAAADDFLISTAGRPGPVRLDAGRLSGQHLAVVRALGLGPGFTLYSWKHSGVVDMYRAGIAERYIQQQGGWSSGVHFQTYLRSLGLYVAEELTLKAPRL
jgi:integrase